MKKIVICLTCVLLAVGILLSATGVMHAEASVGLLANLSKQEKNSLKAPEIKRLEVLKDGSLKCSLETVEQKLEYEIRVLSGNTTGTATGSALGFSVSAKEDSRNITKTASGNALSLTSGVVPAGTAGELTVSGLKEGEQYEVSVRCFQKNEQGELLYSPWSKTEKVTMITDSVAFEGHQYRFVSTSGYTTKEAMRQYCSRVGGHLVDISSAEEYVFLYYVMQEKGLEDACIFRNDLYAMLSGKISNFFWKDGVLKNPGENVAFICEWTISAEESNINPKVTATPTPTVTPSLQRPPVDEVLDLKPEDFTYKSVSGYYSCTGLSKSGYEKFSRYLSKDTVTINLPSVSDTGKKVRGFYSGSTTGYDLSVLMVETSPYIRLVCPDTYVIYSGETGPANDKIISVELNEGMKTIYKQAFYNYTGLTKIALPESVKNYKAEVFKGCTNLVIETLITEGVVMGSAVFDGVTIHDVYIGGKFDATSDKTGTFAHANIEKISFENGITKIPDDALKQCYTMTEIVIPDTVKQIGKRAFKDCISLLTVEFSAAPDKVELGTEAFSGCYLLSDVMLPDNITVYGDGAFKGCISMVIDYMDTSGKKINGAAFEGVRIDKLLITESFTASDYSVSKTSKGALEGAEISEIVFETGISTIPSNAFRATNITEIVIPDTVTYIGNYAFYQCKDLKKVVLTDSVKELGVSAFYGCAALSDIDATHIKVYGETSFAGCKKLVIEQLDTNEKAVMSEAFQGVTINKLLVSNGFTGASEGVGTKKKGSFAGATIQKVAFEPDFITIGDDAFRDSNIKSITLPDTLISIGERAFEACTGLKSIYLPKSTKVLGKEAFTGCSALVNVDYPEGITMGADVFKNSKKVKLRPYK